MRRIVDAGGRKAAGARAALMLACAVLCHHPAQGETMSEAIQRSLSANAALRSQRDKLNATREKLPQAWSNVLPKVSATADYGREIQKVTTPATIDFNLTGDGTLGMTPNAAQQNTYKNFPKTYGVQATQTLFDGGKSFATISAARSAISSEMQTTRGQEQETILRAAAAYLDVLRAQEILQSRRENEAFLTKQMRVMEGRRRFGDVTGSDVALVASRLSGSRYRSAEGESALQQARAVYAQVTGAAPGALVYPSPMDRILPASLDKALALAMRSNPRVLAADFNIGAAKAQVQIAQADFLPTVSVAGGVSRRGNIQTSGDRVDRAYVLGTLSVPLFSGGLVLSRTRESQALLAQRRSDLDSARDEIRAQVISAWSSWEAARVQAHAAEAQVAFAEKAAGAVREQYRVGERALSDLLMAEVDLTAARENAANARRDRVFSSFAVAHAIGGLEPRAIGDSVSTVASASASRASPLRGSDGAAGTVAAPDDWGLRTGSQPAGQPLRGGAPTDSALKASLRR